MPAPRPAPCADQLEAFHGQQDPKAVEAAWPHLGHPDRFIRFAARVALEHQDPKTWQDRALAETDPPGLAHGPAGPGPRRRQGPVPPPKLPADAARPQLGHWTTRLDRRRRSSTCCASTSSRSTAWASPTPRRPPGSIARLDPLFPARGRELNAELCKLLVYLEAPTRRREDDGAAGRGPDAGGADRVRRRPAERSRPAGRPSCARSTSPGSSRRPTTRAGRASAASSARSRTTRSATLTAEEKVALKPILEAPAEAASPIAAQAAGRSSRSGRSTSWPPSSRRA